MKVIFRKIFLLVVMVLTESSIALTDKERQEILEASEAAPAHIVDAASFMMLYDGKFEVVKSGSNNFTCLVMRNPQGRFEPACLNEEAMASVFPTYQYHTARLYEGLSETEVLAEIEQKFKNGELPTAAVGSLVYMMSARNGFYTDDGKQISSFPPHQMYFLPKITDQTFSLTGQDNLMLWQGYPHMSCLIVVTPSAAEIKAN